VIVDDFTNDGLMSKLGTHWRVSSDKVMGGISEGSIIKTSFNGVKCLHLNGQVKLENNGGFIQAGLDLAFFQKGFDVSEYKGLRLTVAGSLHRYSIHLRTTQIKRPWQSYRAHFFPELTWGTLELPFSVFVPHRIKAAMDTSKLRRIGIVAIGRVFQPNLFISEIKFIK